MKGDIFTNLEAGDTDVFDSYYYFDSYYILRTF